MDSVLANTVKPAEVVTVIDGPIPPELQAVLTDFSAKYPQVKLFPLKKNGGLGPALAYGIEQCTHELVARMDAAMYGRRGGWKYFKSNLAMIGKLRELKLISLPTSVFNVGVRFCIQVAIPTSLRGMFYKKALR